MYGFVGPQVSS